MQRILEKRLLGRRGEGASHHLLRTMTKKVVSVLRGKIG